MNLISIYHTSLGLVFRFMQSMKDNLCCLSEDGVGDKSLIIFLERMVDDAILAIKKSF